MFDFYVINTTNDDYEQQTASVALCLQQLTTPLATRRPCSVYNSCDWREVKQEVIQKTMKSVLH